MSVRPFYLTIDSASDDEPEPRNFGSLDTALVAFEQLDEQWQRFAWITEERADRSVVVHMRDGKRQETV